VALFQHFTFPEVLKHQIERTRGNLETQSLLSELAQEFGVATGRYGALRSAIRKVDEKGVWTNIQPDPRMLEEATEPHERGAILVAAMFSAFLEIYKVRTKSVITLASAGSGLLPEGALHPSLVDALAGEATKTARHFLFMCIRALDYCPPFDITFGDYLRALVTADYDMVSDDKYGYRVALIESFRRWGILPDGLKTLSEEQLRWPYARLEYQNEDGEQWNALAAIVVELRDLINRSLYQQERAEVFKTLKQARAQTKKYLADALSSQTAQRDHFMRITGLDLRPDGNIPGLRYRSKGLPSFEVHTVLPTLRVTPDGQILKQLIISVTQRLVDMPVDPDRPDDPDNLFDFRGGSTLIFNMEGAEPTLRYAITRPITDVARLEATRAHRRNRSIHGFGLRETYFANSAAFKAEPFCFLHSDH
jgi:hypothetical protein